MHKLYKILYWIICKIHPCTTCWKCMESLGKYQIERKIKEEREKYKNDN